MDTSQHGVVVNAQPEVLDHLRERMSKTVDVGAREKQNATRDVEPLVKDSISLDATKWTRMAKHCKGVSEEMTTGVLKSVIGRRVKVCKVLG